jgi:hypothetical protein
MVDAMTSWREPYFTDADGHEWHVYDVVRLDGRIRQLELGDIAARQRVFVAPDGRQVVHVFAPGERRDCGPQLLSEQLRLAKARAAWNGTFQPMRRARR